MSDQVHCWERFLLDGNPITRYPDCIYHRLDLIAADLTMFRIFIFSRGYMSHEPSIIPGVCEVCDRDAMFIVAQDCSVRNKVFLCGGCLEKVISIKRIKVGNITGMYDDKYMLARFLEYRRVPLKEIKNGLQLSPHSWISSADCSLCGSTPGTDCICVNCYTHVVRFMISRVILLRDQLIDDVLVAIVRSIIG